MRMVLLLVLALAVAACGAAPPPAPETIADAFAAAGLTVADRTADGALLPELQTAAPSCAALRFAADADGHGARVITCADPDDAATVARYYRSLGEANALFSSHVHADGQLVLQMNGAAPADLFARYVAALP